MGNANINDERHPDVVENWDKLPHYTLENGTHWKRGAEWEGKDIGRSVLLYNKNDDGIMAPHGIGHY